MHRFSRVALIALVAILAAGCRTVALQSDPRSVAAVEIVNDVGAPMLVYYDAGAGDALLGAVQVRGSERFIVTAPAGAVIRVTARSEDGTRTAGPYTVTLEAGATQRVTLR
jgi:hypothetical protein